MNNVLIGEECYRMFVKARQTLNYYKGEIMPFINMNCRKDMTAGDIDCIIWDFYKKILRIVEAKKSNEYQKNSQHRLLKFLQENVKIEGYEFDVYKIIGDAPYDFVQIFSFKNEKYIVTNFNGLKRFLEMDISFLELSEKEYDLVNGKMIYRETI
jgi:hypothetical protein